jgi:hypothetical protein
VQHAASSPPLRITPSHSMLQDDTVSKCRPTQRTILGRRENESAKLVFALGPCSSMAAWSYARAASSAVSNVPSHLRYIPGVRGCIVA